MKRREFIQALAGTLACGLAGSLAARATDHPRQMTLGEWFAKNHQERPHRLNYGRIRQRLREVLEDGHDVLRCELQAPHGGFRFARVYLKEGSPLTWNQPWESECL